MEAEAKSVASQIKTCWRDRVTEPHAGTDRTNTRVFLSKVRNVEVFFPPVSSCRYE